MDIKHYQVQNTLVCTFVPPRRTQAHTCVSVDLGATKLSDLFRTSQLNDSVWEIRLLSWTVLLLFPHGGLVSVWQWPCAKYSHLFWPLLICFFEPSFIFFFLSSTLLTMPCYISIQTPAKIEVTQCHLLSPYFAGFKLWGVGVVFGWRWGQCDAVYPPYMVNIFNCVPGLSLVLTHSHVSVCCCCLIGMLLRELMWKYAAVIAAPHVFVCSCMSFWVGVCEHEVCACV